MVFRLPSEIEWHNVLLYLVKVSIFTQFGFKLDLFAFVLNLLYLFHHWPKTFNIWSIAWGRWHDPASVWVIAAIILPNGSLLMIVWIRACLSKSKLPPGFDIHCWRSPCLTNRHARLNTYLVTVWLKSKFLQISLRHGHIHFLFDHNRLSSEADLLNSNAFRRG